MQASRHLPTEAAFSTETGPVELSLELLKQVSGAGPKGGWEEPPMGGQMEEPLYGIAGPKGGW
jgi:hypothetical protein